MSRRIAPMRARLVLQEPVETDDGSGGVFIAWRDVAPLWAEIRPGSGGEGLWADAPAGRMSQEIVIRWRPGVHPAMRLVGAGRVHDIHAVFDPDGRRRRLVCLCLEQPL